MEIPGTSHISIASGSAKAAAGTGPIQSGLMESSTAPAKSEASEVLKEPEPDELPARQLLEVQGNPGATAENAAKVQDELSPPKNPYPSVQELATIRKAQAMEERAKAQLAESKEYQGVDTRV